jgi:hypothetical protein
MAEAFKVTILMIGVLVGLIMVMEGAIWLLHSTGTVNIYQGTQRREQSLTHTDIQPHIERSRLVHIYEYVTVDASR